MFRDALLLLKIPVAFLDLFDLVDTSLVTASLEFGVEPFVNDFERLFLLQKALPQ